MTWNQSRRWYKQDYHVKAHGENGGRALLEGVIKTFMGYKVDVKKCPHNRLP